MLVMGALSRRGVREEGRKPIATAAFNYICIKQTSSLSCFALFAAHLLNALTKICVSPLVLLTLFGLLKLFL